VVRRALHWRFIVTEICLTAAWVSALMGGAIVAGDKARELGLD